MFSIGDVIEQQAGQTLLAPGHYRIMHLSPENARLSLVSTEVEREPLANLNCTTFVPIAILETFQLVAVIGEE